MNLLRYNIISKMILGEGLYSRVYDHNTYARKLYKLKLKYALYFNKEIHALRTMNGVKGVPSIIAYGKTENNFPYIDMEKLFQIKEVDLETYIPKITSIVENAHKLNVAHCDLKWKNIMLDKENDVVIIDWNSSENVNSDNNFMFLYDRMSICILIIEHIFNAKDINDENVEEFIYDDSHWEEYECWQIYCSNLLDNKLMIRDFPIP